MSRGLPPGRFATLCRWALWALVAIVITGASVRLTGSGLGCSDWPTCEPGEFVPAADFHGWVEFGNRLVTGLVSVAVAVAVLGSLVRRPRRRNLIWWSLSLVAGVAVQVVLGAITVLTHLSPPIVMSHFLASQVLVACATVLLWKAARDHSQTEFPISRAVRGLVWVIAALTAVAMWTGTVVTGAGPHGGDENAERLQLALPDAARIHGITVVVLVVSALSLILVLRRWTKPANDKPANDMFPMLRRARTVVGVMFVQAAIGYLQYFNELPALLVGLHVTGATLLTIAVTRLVLQALSPTNNSGTGSTNSEQTKLRQATSASQTI